jgi:hypothetical protein
MNWFPIFSAVELLTIWAHDALKGLTVTNTSLWPVRACSSKTDQCFIGIYSLYSRGRRGSRWRNERKRKCKRKLCWASHSDRGKCFSSGYSWAEFVSLHTLQRKQGPASETSHNFGIEWRNFRYNCFCRRRTGVTRRVCSRVTGIRKKFKKGFAENLGISFWGKFQKYCKSFIKIPVIMRAIRVL